MLLFGLAPCSNAAAQVYDPAAVKAAFLYRFAAYVDWPPEATGRPAFTIAVAGDDAVQAELARLLPGITVAGRPGVVRRAGSVSDIADADILFVGQAAGPRGRDLLAAAATRPVLVVTDEAGTNAGPGVIDFQQSGRHIRFAISLSAARRHRLRLSPALLGVALRVEGHPGSEGATHDTQP